MNSYGSMGDTLRRSARYCGADVEYAPGYGAHAFRLTVQEGTQQVSDVFHIETESDLNAALNTLLKKATQHD
jgi:hypothetical protein